MELDVDDVKRFIVWMVVNIRLIEKRMLIYKMDLLLLKHKVIEIINTVNVPWD